MFNLKKQKFSVGGLSINVYHSDNISSDKPTMLLVHGIASWAKHWFALAQFLAQDYNIYILDRPGYGDSSNIEITNVDHYITLMKEIIADIHKDSSIIYVGHSWGGYLGIKIALQMNQISRLILLAPFCKYTVSQELLISSHICRDRTVSSVKNSFSSDVGNDILRQYKNDVMQMNAQAILNDFSMVCDTIITIEELKKVSVNTLIIHALDDKVISVRKSIYIADTINNVQLCTVDTGGHNFFIVQPKDIFEKINQFLQMKKE